MGLQKATDAPLVQLEHPARAEQCLRQYGKATAALPAKGGRGPRRRTACFQYIDCPYYRPFCAGSATRLLSTASANVEFALARSAGCG